ncbi:aminotransferase class I/II-fold pyridoxal phosphate-dependent enzyme [Streptomyces lateritius]|uniref:aminotransferase class I/II-fold pyridoxal phosphate-dependent enzyme n=1 Tax=Streptomyces lateritius TaxID=67313 RepID=UPI001989A24B|nr:aminotransferase class I/II-fold pyridoxal phosphate-dependent enzyme [Streptomyces lateritius]GGU01356.1 2-amino-3-ketobutyrate CoA ligase [Streptomyces lateritius]
MKIIRALELEGKSPYFRALQTGNSPRIDMDGRPRMMLGSNNYLGLADHPLVVEGARKALERFGTGSTGSRLLNGTIDLHLELEAEIADWYGTEAAIVFTTGHQSNLGTVGALAGRGDVIVADSDAHASLHDAARFTDAQSVRFRHNDIDNLAEKLTAAAKRGRPTMVTVDGVYSMEGDLAPIDQIAEVCLEHNALLLVDEAHSVGVLGPDLTGVTELYGKADTTPLRTGTFSKSIASTGGFAVGSHDLIDAVRTNGRAFLFTAAGVPAAIGGALAAVRLIRSAEGRERAERCLANARFLRDSLVSLGVPLTGPAIGPDGAETVTPIVPVIVGESLRAFAKWHELYEHGVFAALAHYPAVPLDRALLRLAVTAEHTFADLEEAATSIHTVLEPAVERRLVA